MLAIKSLSVITGMAIKKILSLNLLDFGSIYQILEIIDRTLTGL